MSQTDGSKMILYLVRHGESVFNAEGRIQGQLDPPLSELGLRQATALAEAFTGQTIQAVFASPLARAWQTAEPICAALDVGAQADERLKEINAGIFQGLRWDEIQAAHPEAAARWRAQEPDFVVPQGESRRALMARALAVLEAIRETGLERVLVVAHGGVLTAGLKALLGVPAERNPFSLFNGAISQVTWDKQAKLVTLNQVEHLVRCGVHQGKAGDLY
ncbi:MAG: histidine phosphatase family protein [Pirellulales bacterium]|nr:histidine phosphatase family protein [Pirellulales bacterium]